MKGLIKPSQLYKMPAVLRLTQSVIVRILQMYERTTTNRRRQNEED